MRGIFLPARSLATAEGLYKGWVRFRVSGLGDRIRVLTWDLFEASERDRGFHGVLQGMGVPTGVLQEF